uniref:non-specific serine/threonine protein kinase n=1 Tax=Astyanax mexicanus TaxID=7994 RepID=A0A8B9JCI9_ASTMX
VSDARPRMGQSLCICSRNTFSKTLSLFTHEALCCGQYTLARVSCVCVCVVLQKGSLWSVLEKMRDKGSSMAESRVLHVLRGICEGLKAIHDKGYAHRDLKPTNVLLEENDRPVLMDLGSMNKARIEVRGSREAMTIQVGLPAVEFSCIDKILISLGCVLYCMMMLEGPYDLIFQKGDSVALAVQNPVTIPQPCSYSAGLQNLLSSIMVTNPQERPDINWVLEQVKSLQGSDAGPVDTNRV